MGCGPTRMYHPFLKNNRHIHFKSSKKYSGSVQRIWMTALVTFPYWAWYPCQSHSAHQIEIAIKIYVSRIHLGPCSSVMQPSSFNQYLLHTSTQISAWGCPLKFKSRIFHFLKSRVLHDRIWNSSHLP